MIDLVTFAINICNFNSFSGKYFLNIRPLSITARRYVMKIRQCWMTVDTMTNPWNSSLENSLNYLFGKPA